MGVTDCPRPSRTMRLRGATWQYGCDCESCTAHRMAYEAARGGPRGSVAPRQDVDEIAVERTIHGHSPAGLNKAERLEVTRQLTERGATARQIADRLRMDPRTVHRYRTELRMESVA